MTGLTGKIALVTGASRGLGFAVAAELAKRGVHVIALARTVGGLEDLDDIIAKGAGSCTLTPMDITDDAGLERLGAAIHGRWGKLDLMVHCAAEAAPMSPAEHAAAKDFDKAMAVNARSCQRLIRVIDPLLKAAERTEAVFIDDSLPIGAKFNASYGASKAAARAIAMSYAAENMKHGPKVWLAQPPAMPTALRARAHPGENTSALTTTRHVAETLVGLIGSAGVAPQSVQTL
jgi:NAD(P)-dependent dehydrogenase (short-subunit alcohol dehydrogenase family)